MCSQGAPVVRAPEENPIALIPGGKATRDLKANGLKNDDKMAFLLMPESSEEAALYPWAGEDDKRTTPETAKATYLMEVGGSSVESYRALLDYPRSWMHQCDAESAAYQGADGMLTASDETDWYGQQPDLVKSIFVRWGQTECPIGSDVVYSGFMAGGSTSNTGSGANFVCLHSESQPPKSFDDSSHLRPPRNLIYGVEFERRKNQNQDAACVVCQRSGAVQTYVQWGRQTCTNGHHREYTGNIMSHDFTQTRAEDVCVDYAHKVSPTPAAHGHTHRGPNSLPYDLC